MLKLKNMRQKRQGKRLLTAFLALGLLWTNSAKGQENSGESEVLKACEQAVNDLEAANKAQADLVSQLKLAAQLKENEIKALEKEQSAWYNRPELLGLIGLSLGLIAGGIIAK